MLLRGVGQLEHGGEKFRRVRFDLSGFDFQSCDLATGVFQYSLLRRISL
jgi:hypothetical protein